MDAEVIGLIRFSYLGLGGYQRPFQDLVEQKAFLYGKERLERRLTLFENLTVPSLRAQTNSNYRLILMTGDEFPKWAEERVLTAIDGLPVEIVKKPPMKVRHAVEEILDHIFSGDAKCEIAFQMDDDAITKHFIETLWDAVPMAEQILKQRQFFGYYFRKGFILDVTGEEPNLESVNLDAPLALAVAVMRRPGLKMTPYSYGHFNILNSMPCFVETGTHGFVRSLHADCDIRYGVNRPFTRAKKREMDALKKLEVFLGDFGICEQNLINISKFVEEE